MEIDQVSFDILINHEDKGRKAIITIKNINQGLLSKNSLIKMKDIDIL